MSTVKSRLLDSIKQQEVELVQLAAEGDIASDTDNQLGNPTQSTGENLLEPSESDPKVTTEQDAKESEGVQDLEYWKKRALDAEYRFGKYKGKTDATIYDLRVQVTKLRENILTLTEQVQSQPKVNESAEVDGIFTDDVVNIIGEEATEAIKKAIQSAHDRVAKAEAKLQEKETESIKTEQVKSARQSYEEFVSLLENFVPDCRIMNDDPEFVSWLQQPDNTGVPKINRLQAAQKIGDVERVATFFDAYKAEKNPVVKPTPRKDTIASRIGPVQRSSTTEVKKVSDDSVTVSFIRDHESNVARGKFRGRESEKKAIDKKIEQAYLSGKIINQ